MNPPEIRDVIILGAGPAGLAAAIYAMERKLNIILVEANTPGGQLVTLYPAKDIYDYPSYTQIKAKDLALRMVEQAESRGVEIIGETTIDSVVPKEPGFSLKSGSQEFLGKSVILATGMGHYQPRHLGVPGEEKYTNKGIYYQKLPEKMVGKRVLVIGGGDTALETAVAVAEAGATVTLIHRSSAFRAQEATVAKAKSLSIPLLLNSRVVAFHGTERVERAEVLKGTGATSLISVDAVGICIGVELITQFLSQLGAKTANQAVVVDADMQTTIAGVFACGDITVPAGKYRRISVAVGSAATAVNGVYQYLKQPYWAKK